MKIAVGMSGGVDSSVAAAILKDRGHEVIGLSMALWNDTYACTGVKKYTCFGPNEKEDIQEARRICDSLGIPMYVFDCSSEYGKTVIEYFKSEYRSARTPNPCIVCNEKIKFDALLKTAESSGLQFDAFATGHYANVEHDPAAGRLILKKARDSKKDQSYFLYRLSQPQLSKVMFPLGELTKEKVRRIARSKGIAVSEKEESQDFYGGDYRELLGVREEAGDIVLTGGKVVGRHRGLWNYTPGQRKGLGIAFPEPLYVISLDAEHNAVIVGTKSEISVSSFVVNDLNWIAVEKPASSFTAMVKLRSTHKEIESLVEMSGKSEAKVTLKSRNEPIAPGQSAVFYDGDSVIGGGIIDRTL
jgi:tRNA-specific 2-thiouridylase